MRCLCCGKPFNDKSSSEEIKNGWHNSCIKKFFGTNLFPDIDISSEALEELALETVGKGFTVPGVQKKLSLHLSKEDIPRLTLINFPTGYILKPQTKEYAALPEAEYLVMQMAKATGIKTVPFALIVMHSQNDELAYITKRVDRIYSCKNNEDIKMLAMEDFCQLDMKLTMDKYHGSYERCAKIIAKYSCQSLLDQTEFFLRLVFSFVVGNSDMHLKNFSLMETEYMSGEYFLSPAYDMLPVNIILPEDQEEFALSLNGKKNKISRKDFIAFAISIGLNEKIAENLIDKIVSMQDKYISYCMDSFLPSKLKEDLEKLIIERCNRLSLDVSIKKTR